MFNKKAWQLAARFSPALPILTDSRGFFEFGGYKQTPSVL